LINVMLVEDDVYWQDMMKDILKSCSDIQLCSICSSAEDSIRYLEQNGDQIQVMLIDINLDNTDYTNQEGIELCLKIKGSFPNIKIIMLSSLDDPATIMDSMTYGSAKNFISKKYYMDIPQEIRNANQDKFYMHYYTAEQFRYGVTQNREDHLRAQFSNTQIEILNLLDQGCSLRDIAITLKYDEKVISNYLARFSKEIKGLSFLQRMKLKRTKYKDLVILAKSLNIIP
jgi:DNA-binding NarL/FixJ family response regulator